LRQIVDTWPLRFLSVSAGCASLNTANTPAQERSYAAFAACQAAGKIPIGATLDRVQADGRMLIHYHQDGLSDWDGVKTCLAEERRKQVKPVAERR